MTMILKKKKDKEDSPGFTMFLLSPGAPKTSTSRQLHQIEDINLHLEFQFITVLSCAGDHPDDDDGDETDDDDS